MATPVELLIKLTGIGGVVSGLGAAATALDQISSSARNTGRQLQNFGGSLMGIGTRITAGVTAPLALATTGLVRMAAEAVESENLFEVSMGDMADAAREFSMGLQRDLGLNGFAIRRQIGVMQNFTTAMGISTDAAYEMSTSVVALSSDMASFFNITDQEAFNAIQSGLSGISMPLRRFGIVVTETQVAAAAAAMGLTGELTEQQKVMIRYNLILQQTQNAQGDLARTIDSPANAMRVLGGQVQLLGIELGTALLPSIRNVVIAIRDNVIPVLSRWIEAFQNLEPRMRGMIILGGLLVAAIGPALLVIGGLVSLIGTLIVVLGAVLSPIGLLVVGLAAIAGAVFFARDSFDDLISAFEILFGFADGAVGRFARDVSSAFIGGIGAAITVTKEILQSFLSALSAGFLWILRKSADVAQALGQDGLADGINAAADAFSNFANGTDLDSTGRLAEVGRELGEAWGDARDNFSEAVGDIQTLANGAADFLGGAMEETVEATNAASMSFEELGVDALGAANDVATASESIKDSLKQIGAGLSGMGGGDDERTVADVFKEWQQGFEDMQALGVQAAESLTQAFDSFTSNLSSGIGDAVAQSIVFGKSFGEAVANVAKKAVAQLISALVSLGVQYVLNAALAQTLALAMTGFAVAQASIIAAAWAPAAALASLASFGSNAGPAAGALTSTVALAQALASFQQGTDSFTATGPRLIMVGENGPERVSVNPLSGGGGGRGGRAINIFIPEGAMFDQIGFDRVAERIGDYVLRRIDNETV